jgi:hypothetical protein
MVAIRFGDATGKPLFGGVAFGLAARGALARDPQIDDLSHCRTQSTGRLVARSQRANCAETVAVRGAAAQLTHTRMQARPSLGKTGFSEWRGPLLRRPCIALGNNSEGLARTLEYKTRSSGVLPSIGAAVLEFVCATLQSAEEFDIRLTGKAGLTLRHRKLFWLRRYERT